MGSDKLSPLGEPIRLHAHGAARSRWKFNDMPLQFPADLSPSFIAPSPEKLPSAPSISVQRTVYSINELFFVFLKNLPTMPCLPTAGPPLSFVPFKGDHELGGKPSSLPLAQEASAGDTRITQAIKRINAVASCFDDEGLDHEVATVVPSNANPRLAQTPPPSTVNARLPDCPDPCTTLAERPLCGDVNDHADSRSRQGSNASGSEAGPVLAHGCACDPGPARARDERLSSAEPAPASAPARAADHAPTQKEVTDQDACTRAPVTRPATLPAPPCATRALSHSGSCTPPPVAGVQGGVAASLAASARGAGGLAPAAMPRVGGKEGPRAESPASRSTGASCSMHACMCTRACTCSLRWPCRVAHHAWHGGGGWG